MKRKTGKNFKVWPCQYWKSSQ